jgi:hypothetical protein
MVAIIRSVDLGFPPEVARGGWSFTAVMPSRRGQCSKHRHRRLRQHQEQAFTRICPETSVQQPAHHHGHLQNLHRRPSPAPPLHRTRIGGKRNPASLHLRGSSRTTRSRYQIGRLLLLAPRRQEPPPRAAQDEVAGAPPATTAERPTAQLEEPRRGRSHHHQLRPSRRSPRPRRQPPLPRTTRATARDPHSVARTGPPEDPCPFGSGARHHRGRSRRQRRQERRGRGCAASDLVFAPGPPRAGQHGG